jgi:hypothetical protein
MIYTPTAVSSTSRPRMSAHLVPLCIGAQAQVAGDGIDHLCAAVQNHPERWVAALSEQAYLTGSAEHSMKTSKTCVTLRMSSLRTGSSSALLPRTTAAAALQLTSMWRVLSWRTSSRIMLRPKVRTCRCQVKRNANTSLSNGRCH